MSNLPISGFTSGAPAQAGDEFVIARALPTPSNFKLTTAQLATYMSTGLSSLTLGTQSTTQGTLILANTAVGAFPTTLQASNSASAAWTLTLPTTAGSNGFILTTNGSGVTSWTNPTALGIDLDVGSTAITNGTTGRILYDNAGTLGEALLTYSAATLQLGAADTSATATVTITIATPGVVTWSSHGLSTGTPVVFSTTGALPTGITAGTTYYVIAVDANTFQIATSYANATAVSPTAVTTSGSQSGTHTGARGAVDQVFRVQSASGTSNFPGADFTIQGSRGTGTGAGGSIIFQLAPAGSSGTAQNAYAQRFSVGLTSASVAASTSTAALGVHLLHAGRIIVNNGAVNGSFDPATWKWPSTASIGFASTGDGNGSSLDTILTRAAAATLQLGAADAAAPVAQTFKVQSVVAGTSNTAGANFTIQGSQGTGDKAGGSIIFQVAPAGSSGTAQNAYSTALTIASDRSATFAGFISVGSFSYFQNNMLLQSNTSYFALGASADVRLFRDAANTLALRNGTSAQLFRVYNTYTSSTNYETFKIDWITTANTCLIGTQKGSGGGTARALEFQTDGTTRLTIAADGTTAAFTGVVTAPNLATGRTLGRAFTPLDNQPPASNFATLDTRNSIAVLDFDDATDEFAVFASTIPQAATISSGLTVIISWAATSATSGACVWGVQFAKLTGVDLDVFAFDTATTATTTTSGTSGVVNTTTITVAVADTDGLAAGDCYAMQVYRDANAGGDTMTGDAELIAVEIRQVA